MTPENIEELIFLCYYLYYCC